MNNQSTRATDLEADSLALDLFGRGQLDDSSLKIDVARIRPDTTFTTATFSKRLKLEGKTVDVVLCGSLESPILKLPDQALSPFAIGRIQLDGKWEMISNNHASTIFTGIQQLHHENSLMEPLNLEASSEPSTSEMLESDVDGFTGQVNLLAQLKSEILEVFPEKWEITTGQSAGETTAMVTRLRITGQSDDESSVEFSKRITAIENEGTRAWGDPEYSLSIRNSRGADRLSDELDSDDLKKLFCEVLISIKSGRTS